MVIPCAAAQAVGAAGSAGATALGLGMGKTDLDLSRDLFQQQMRQTKRLWTADWAEASLRHGEQSMQAAQQHFEAQAMATAAYFQAEKLASQGIKLARDQDSRAYEMAWRAEVRESLRDELGNQNNRFNIVMLCDTVCLGCVFTLVADGSPPVDTPSIMLNAYVLCLGVSIMLFSISLWGSVIVVRRLHDNTAARLERKLFAQSEDLKQVWQQQLAQNVPTGPQEMYLLHQAYETWVAEYLDPIGNLAIHMLSIGVVTMFITAGLLVHNVYLIDYNTSSAVPIFWSTVLVTSTSVLYMKFSEDRKEKQKEGVYDISWHDNSTEETGPYAKINKAAEELSSSTAASLGSAERVESYYRRERIERNFCAKSQSLHNRVESLRKEAARRTKTRQEVLQLLTTATEEMDALPEELTTRLNKMLHSIDEADQRTADYLVTPHSESMLQHEASHADWSRLSRFPISAAREQQPPMALHPIDAQRTPVVSLGSLRKKLGENSITTLLRLRNTSDEPLRLKSGVQLKDGKYIKALHAPVTTAAGGNDDENHTTTVVCCYHLYPITEIPPRTEVLVAARNRGGFVPTSGIEGEIVYTNREETWNFKISFRNPLLGSVRRCRVEAYPTANNNTNGNDNEDDDDSVVLNKNQQRQNDEEHWQISKDEFDSKKAANNEFVISIDLLRGQEATKASYRKSHSKKRMTLKSGFLFKNIAFGLGFQWQKMWVELTPKQIVLYSTSFSSSFSLQDENNKASADNNSNNSNNKQKSMSLDLRDIASIREGTDMVKTNVFEIICTNSNTSSSRSISGPPSFRLSAGSPKERDDWIKAISKAIATPIFTTNDNNIIGIQQQQQQQQTTTTTTALTATATDSSSTSQTTTATAATAAKGTESTSPHSPAAVAEESNIECIHDVGCMGIQVLPV